jgi:AbiV family abortive infection protein
MTMDDEVQTRRNITLKSVERNARQLLSDAELLFDHGRYGRAAALGVLAVEEVGKYYLLKWNRQKPEKATRHHDQNSEQLRPSAWLKLSMTQWNAHSLQWVCNLQAAMTLVLRHSKNGWMLMAVMTKYLKP